MMRMSGDNARNVGADGGEGEENMHAIEKHNFHLNSFLNLFLKQKKRLVQK